MLYNLYTSDFFNKSELWHLSDVMYNETDRT